MNNFKIEFSKWYLVMLYGVPFLIFFVLHLYIYEGRMTFGVYLWLFLVAFFLYSFFLQFEYKVIEVNNEKIIINYPINFIVKQRQFFFIDIDSIEYKPVIDSWVFPFFKIYLKKGKKHKFTLRTRALLALIKELELYGLKIEKIQYGRFRP